MAKKGALDEVFNGNIERWTHSTMFMDAIAALALFASRFTRPVANFARTCINEIVDEWYLTVQTKDFPQPSNVHT